MSSNGGVWGESKRFGGWALLGFGVIAVAIVFTLIISAMFLFSFGWFQRSTADYRGGTEAIEQTRANGNFRIAAYQQFFDLCSSVQAQEDRIRLFMSEVEAKQGTPEASIAQTNLTAVRSVRAGLVREYNGKASRDFTEGQFRDSDLPYQIDINNEETQCAL